MSSIIKTSVKGAMQERYQVVEPGTSGLAADTIITSEGVSCNDNFINLKVKRLADEVLSIEKCSWDLISEISSAGTASTLWAVGDKKSVTLASTFSMNSGSVAAGTRLYFRILGFDHNMNVESSGVHTIHFGLATNANNIEICLANQIFSSSRSTGGGTDGTKPIYGPYDETWNRGCSIRTACTTFKNCLPADLQGVIKTLKKGQSDNSFSSQPASTTYSSECKQQDDDVFIMSNKEVFGTDKYASSQTSNEGTVCARYAYYTSHSTNSDRIKYNHSSTGTARYWWLRSFYRWNVGSDYSGSLFCNVNTDGTANNDYGSSSIGFVPCFAV